jgi:hypothetical protein
MLPLDSGQIKRNLGAIAQGSLDSANSERGRRVVSQIFQGPMRKTTPAKGYALISTVQSDTGGLDRT